VKSVYKFLFEPKNRLNQIISIGLLSLVALFGLYELYGYLKITFSFPSTMDTQLFLTVGRAINEGMTPYVDMYENKPPAIFWLSALSYKLTDDTYLNNIFSMFCTAATGFVPIIACYLTVKKHPMEKAKRRAIIAAFVMFGFMIWMFSDFRAGRSRVEGYGVFFISLYTLWMYLADSEKLKAYSWQIFLAGFTAMLGVMFKEPFAFVAVAVGLILCRTKKDFIYKLILPLVYGGVMGVILLAATGTLSAYLEIYLQHMLGTHISVYGSVWTRGLNFIYPMMGTIMFDFAFELVILLLFFFAIAIFFVKADLKTKNGKMSIVLSILKLLLALYLVCLAVGAGGQYYRHHFALSVPFYIALSFVFLSTICQPFKSEKKINTQKLEIGLKRVLSVFIVLCMCSVVILPFFSKYSPRDGWHNLRGLAKGQAAYVDSILDVCDEEIYQYLGFAGEQFFYSYTKELPKGPIFAQDEYNFQTKGWFTENLLSQLDDVNIVIYHENNTGVIYDEVEAILSSEFTTDAPEEVKTLEMPSYFPYTVYYRK